MQSQAIFPRWTTAAIADVTHNASTELSELGKHVNRCNGSRGRWFALQCASDAVQDFVAPRFVTTLVIVGGIVALAAMVF